MLIPVIVLAVWVAYVELEHPNRVNECPYAEHMCKTEQGG